MTYDPNEINYVNFIALKITDRKGSETKTYLLEPVFYDATPNFDLSSLKGLDDQYLVLDENQTEVFIAFEDLPILEEGYQREIGILSSGYQIMLRGISFEEYPDYVQDFLIEYSSNPENHHIATGTLYENYVKVEVTYTEAAPPEEPEEPPRVAFGPTGGPGPPGPPYRPGVFDVSDIINEYGVFTESTSIEIGRVDLTIPEDTTGLTEEGEPLSEINVTEMAEPPAPPEDTNIIGLTYDLGPDRATFQPPITITFTYDEADIPEGVDEEDLVIAIYDEDAGEWVVLEDVTVDPVTNTISASVSHFTAFTILAFIPAPPAPPAPPPAPPAPPPAPPVITAPVVPPPVPPVVTAPVVPPPVPVVPAPPAPPVAPPNWGLIGGIIAGCIVVGLLVYFFVWRKRGILRLS